MKIEDLYNRKVQVIILLSFLLALSVLLGLALGPRNACPECTDKEVVKLVFEGGSLNLPVSANYGTTTYTFSVLPTPTPALTPTPSPVPTPTECPDCVITTATPTPTPTVTPTATPTPTPPYTGIRKYVEDRRYVTVAEVECRSPFLIRAVDTDLCATEAIYGYNVIYADGQVFYDNGRLVYVRTSIDRYELAYMSGLDKHFQTHEDYVAFCIQANINAGGTK